MNAGSCPPPLGKNYARVVTEVSIPEAVILICKIARLLDNDRQEALHVSQHGKFWQTASRRQRKRLPDFLISSKIFYHHLMQSKPRFDPCFSHCVI